MDVTEEPYAEGNDSHRKTNYHLFSLIYGNQQVTLVGVRNGTRNIRKGVRGRKTEGN
jgi:hypothetical protein